MSEKEDWKSRLKWDLLVIGLFALVAGVYLFARSGDRQGVSIRSIPVPTIDHPTDLSVAPRVLDAIFTATSSSPRIAKPNTTLSRDLCRWNDCN